MKLINTCFREVLNTAVSKDRSDHWSDQCVASDDVHGLSSDGQHQALRCLSRPVPSLPTACVMCRPLLQHGKWYRAHGCACTLNPLPTATHHRRHGMRLFPHSLSRLSVIWPVVDRPWDPGSTCVCCAHVFYSTSVLVLNADRSAPSLNIYEHSHTWSISWAMKLVDNIVAKIFCSFTNICTQVPALN